MNDQVAAFKPSCIKMAQGNQELIKRFADADTLEALYAPILEHRALFSTPEGRPDPLVVALHHAICTKPLHKCGFKRYCPRCGHGETPKGPRIMVPLSLHKAVIQQPNKNYLIEVEASNEMTDLEGDTILQEALLRSKEYFLHNGVISKDHAHKELTPQGIVYHEENVIGEPLAVIPQGDTVIVQCELYGNKDAALGFIKLLEAGSSRVKASVGGTVLEKEDGATIRTVLWDDLALTIAPVNPHVSGAKMIPRSLLQKTLTVGYGTDHAAFKNGRALQGGNKPGAADDTP